MSNDTFFQFTCDAPAEGVHFVSAPHVRATLDIAWSCLAVLILSTWELSDWRTVEVPSALRRSKRERFRRLVGELNIRIVQVLLAVLVPEYVIIWAVNASLESRKTYRNGKVYASHDEVDWSLPKCYFISTRGFRVRFGSSEPEPPHVLNSAEDLQTSEYDSMLVANKNNIEVSIASAYSAATPTTFLTGEQLLYLRQIGVLQRLPSTTEAEIDDRNKSSALLQAFAMIQTLWLIISVIFRYTQHLIVTQIEVVTLAFAVQNLITRAIDWHRPKDLRVPIILSATRSLSANEQAKFDRLAERDIFNYHDLLMGVLIGALFGGLHCLAWNDQFPTLAEQISWRVAAVTTTILPLSFYACVRLADAGDLFDRFSGVCLGIYGLARLYITVETVRTLFYQPTGAFVGTWAVNFPHLG